MSRSSLLTSSTPQPDVGKKFVHEQIADVARGLAGEFWEQMCTGSRKTRGVSAQAWASAGRFRRTNPDQQAYIDGAWQEFIEAARGSMLILLNRKDIPEPVKADIYQALMLDGLVNPKKISPEAAAAMAAKRPQV